MRRAARGAASGAEHLTTSRVVAAGTGSRRITTPTSKLSRSGVGVMTADITEVGLAELLHLPPVQVRAEQVGPGRQGGPLLVVIGISLTGLALWGWVADTLGWSVFALTALGAALTMTGVGLVTGLRNESRPSTCANPQSACCGTRRSPVAAASVDLKQPMSGRL